MQGSWGWVPLMFLSRKTSRIFYRHTIWRRIMIPFGTKPGILGLSRTLRSWVFLRASTTGSIPCPITTWLFTSFRPSKESFESSDAPTSALIKSTGFFRSIQLRNENSLQDTLRLLTLWFKFGSHDDVSNAMATGFSIVDVDTWLDVIPQIIARIQTPSVNIRRNIDMLLTDVGKAHPQALLYPLTVA